jgi:hypothetical protein
MLENNVVRPIILVNYKLSEVPLIYPVVANLEKSIHKIMKMGQKEAVKVVSEGVRRHRLVEFTQLLYRIPIIAPQSISRWSEVSNQSVIFAQGTTRFPNMYVFVLLAEVILAVDVTRHEIE